jgi:hypothetical protein
MVDILLSVSSLLSGSRLDQVLDIFRQLGIGICSRATMYRQGLYYEGYQLRILAQFFFYYIIYFRYLILSHVNRLLSVFVNPVVYDFWSRMQSELLMDLARIGTPLEVTGDGQESCIILFSNYLLFSYNFCYNFQPTVDPDSGTESVLIF